MVTGAFEFFWLCIFLYFPIFYKSKCKTFYIQGKITIIGGERGGKMNTTGPRTKAERHMHSNRLQTNPLKRVITVIAWPSYPRVDQRSFARSSLKSRHATYTLLTQSTHPVTLSTEAIWPVRRDLFDLGWVSTGSHTHLFFFRVFTEQLWII